MSLHDAIRDGTWIHVEVSVTRVDRRSSTRTDPIGNGKLIDDSTCTLTHKLKARYKIQDEFIDDVRRFGFSNAAALGWELIPFSFVVDWAIGIGDWLQRQDALLGARNFSFNPSVSERLEYSTSSTNGGTAFSRSLRRTHSMNQTSLSIPVPRYDPSSSLRKVVTGLSLIRLLGR
jgi:hypothetical protein